MNVVGILREAGLLTIDGLADVFRHGILRKKIPTISANLRLTEERFEVATLDLTQLGLLNDVTDFLSRMEKDSQFATVCKLIAAAIDDDKWLELSVAKNIAVQAQVALCVRYSFEPAIHPCLLQAQLLASDSGRTKTMKCFAPIRYSGIGEDARLVAFAAMFLNLSIYAETGYPWELEQIVDEDEPVFDAPTLEISFPPAEFHQTFDEDLEKSLKKCGIPGVIAHKKYQIESAIVDYIAGRSVEALAFISEGFLTSGRLAPAKTKLDLLDQQCVSTVTELIPSTIDRDAKMRFVIVFEAESSRYDTIVMERSANFPHFGAWRKELPNKIGVRNRVSTSGIRREKATLLPARYLTKGPMGNLSSGDWRTPSRYQMIDLFRVIRPKTTRHVPGETLNINEVRAGDITDQGEIYGRLRQITVRDNQRQSLDQQRIRAGDILFTHKGPVGRVTFITEETVEPSGHARWAGQSLLILRARKRTSDEKHLPTCDPRVAYMYLLTQRVRHWWIDTANGGRSPAIPIMQVEAFALPDRLLQQNEPRAEIGEANLRNAEYQEQVLAQFEARAKLIAQTNDLRATMQTGLENVWNILRS